MKKNTKGRVLKGGSDKKQLPEEIKKMVEDLVRFHMDKIKREIEAKWGIGQEESKESKTSQGEGKQDKEVSGGTEANKAQDK